MNKTVATALLLVILAATTASAQTPATRGFVTINGGYQMTANDFTDSRSFVANVEEGRFNSDYTVKAGPSFDVSGGGTVWRRLGVGVGVSRFSRSTPLHLDGEIPHPFFFNRPRVVSGDVGGLKREELAVHIQLRAIAPVGNRLQVMAFGGPSFFRLKQDVVTDIAYTDEYPYDSATFRSATTTSRTGSKLGLNAGGDVAFFFTRQVGVGFTAQVATATVQVPLASDTKADVKVGGFQTGGGLRLRF